MRKQHFVLVEGETEKSLIESLNTKTNRIAIANCWTDDSKKLGRRLRRYGRNCQVYIVFDTDKIESLDRFVEGILHLSKIHSQISLLQQTTNFEDELVFSCADFNKKNDLFREYCRGGERAFKNHFVSAKNRLQKLENCGLDPLKLWSRPITIPSIKAALSKKIVDSSAKDLLI